MKDAIVPTVNVLMSTYNGDFFLYEQLESVFSQSGVDIKLDIRDDGSQDKTVNQIREFINNSNHNITLKLGENIGPNHSFINLLSESSNDVEFYAFCDQDDIWQENKLIAGIDMIKKLDSNKPILYFSGYESINSVGKHIANSKPPKLIGFNNSVVENVAPGCTVIMNRYARDLLMKKFPKNALMHDWWSYLVISAFGIILYDNNSYIKYRQHKNNAIGHHQSSLVKNILKIAPFLKNISNEKKLRVTDQLAEFNEIYGSQLDIEKRQLICDILESKNQLSKRISLILSGKVKRNAFWDSMMFYSQVLIGKF